MHEQIIYAPLSSLRPSALNVRKTGGKKVEDLAASIRASGLQQNLGVLPDGKHYGVVFGGRRLRALQQLAKAGELPASLADGIPCRVLTEEEARQASLAENTIREQMHPLDQFAAFQAMADAGDSDADIAAKFGVTERVVQQRKRLARVSPKLLKAYGEGEMKLDQLQAFAATEDHAAQESCWKRARGSEYASRPEEIRRELARTEVGLDDFRVQLVSLEAYEAAGGQLRRDLFTDDAFIADVPLLDRLLVPALERLAEVVRGEGWGWVEIRDQAPAFNARRVLGRETDWQTNHREQQELEAKSTLTLAEMVRLSELDDGTEWTAEQKAGAGAVITIARGDLDITRGLLREGDVAPDGAPGEPDDEDDDGPIGTSADTSPPEPAEKDPSAIPQRLVHDLTLRRTGELRLAMHREPTKAVTALAAALASQWRARYPSRRDDGILIGMPSRALEVGKQYEAAAEIWRKRLAFDGPVLDWLVEQPWDTTITLLAFLASESLDVVKRYPGQTELGDALAVYLDVDLADTWRPDPAFLKDMPAAAIFAALEGFATDEALARARKMKKAELAGYAAQVLGPTRWVPACVRIPERAKTALASVEPPAKKSGKSKPAAKPAAKKAKSKPTKKVSKAAARKTPKKRPEKKNTARE